MSTRSIIGYYTDEEKKAWKGVYHHWDGYPTGVGVTLLKLGRERGFAFIKKRIVDDTPQGWSTINKDWDLEPVNMRELENFMDNKAPEHYAPDEGDMVFTEKSSPGESGMEYLYLISEKGIDIYEAFYHSEGEHMVGMFGMGAPDIGEGEGCVWRYMGSVAWEDTEQYIDALEKQPA